MKPTTGVELLANLITGHLLFDDLAIDVYTVNKNGAKAGPLCAPVFENMFLTHNQII